MSKFNYFNPNSITILSLILFTTPLISQQTIPTFPPDTLPTFPPGACCVIPADQGCKDIICFYFDRFCCDVQFDQMCEAIAYSICHPPVQTTFVPSIQTTTTTTQITNIPTPSPIPISEPTNTATTTTTFEPTDIPPTPEPTFSPIFIPTQTGLCCYFPQFQACQDFICNNRDPLCCDFEWDRICDSIAQEICHPPNFNMTAAPSFQIPIPTPEPTYSPIFIPTQTGLCCTVDQACQDFICNNGDPFCCNFEWDGICDDIAQEICQYPPNFNMTAAPSFQIPIPTSTPTKLPTIATPITIIPTTTHFWWRPASNPCCDCTRASQFPGCPGKRACEVRICSRDEFCCWRKWDVVCGIKSNAICKGIETAKCCECTNHQKKKKKKKNGYAGCAADKECETEICAVDEFCCAGRWDLSCANKAVNICVQQSKLQT